MPLNESRIRVVWTIDPEGRSPRTQRIAAGRSRPDRSTRENGSWKWTDGEPTHIICGEKALTHGTHVFGMLDANKTVIDEVTFTVEP